ncbi:hypothetical protein BST28156_02670 [Burkholderia stagnalis]|nr:hypothetical protein BST28156_02670 [Burkholderia stagnalis]
MREHARARLELLVRIFRVEPHLDARAARRDGQRVERRQVALGLQDHPFDEIDAGHCLGHAMLDLQPRVHFEEMELARARIEHEFDGARRRVVDRAGEPHRARVQRAALRVAQAGCGRLLDHLLVAPLHRAVALAERDHAAAPVAEDLHLDVPRVLDELLQIDARMREVRAAEPHDALERRRELRGVAAQRHADAAAARRAFQHHRIADRVRFGQRRRDAGQQPRAGQQRDTVLARQRARGVLEAERAHLVGARPDEAHAGRRARIGEIGVLRQEAVAGMHGLRARGARRVENRRDVQVAVGRRRRADAHRFVGQPHVTRVAVGFRVDRDRCDAEPLQRADHAARDFAAVRDEDFPESHVASRRAAPKGVAGSSRNTAPRPRSRPASQSRPWTATAPSGGSER